MPVILLRELTVDQNVHCRSENNGNLEDKGYEIANPMNFRTGKVLVEVSYKSRSFFEMHL